MKEQVEEEEIIAGINITPLVDVILVLLIIFMVTATYILSPAIKVELPRASTGEENPPSPLGIVITEDGALFLNGKPATERDLRSFIRERSGDHPGMEAVIAAHREVKHGRVVEIIDLVKGEGIEKFAINIEPVK